MSTHLLVFPSFFRFLHNFDLAKLATSSLRVNPYDAGGYAKLCKKLKNV